MPGPQEIISREATKIPEQVLTEEKPVEKKEDSKEKELAKKAEDLMKEIKAKEKPKKETVTIRKLGTETTVDRDYFVSVQESADGLIFNFKNGMHLVYTNQHLDPSYKVRVVAGARIDKGNMIIDLDNPTKPVSIELI